jgi:hypothetical protein
MPLFFHILPAIEINVFSFSMNPAKFQKTGASLGDVQYVNDLRGRHFNLSKM